MEEMHNEVKKLQAAFMVATDAVVIEICQDHDICHTDEDGFNRPLAVLNVFEALMRHELTNAN